MKTPRFCEEHVLTLSGIIPFDETVFASLETRKSVLTTLLYKLFLNSCITLLSPFTPCPFIWINDSNVGVRRSITIFDLVAVVNEPFFMRCNIPIELKRRLRWDLDVNNIAKDEKFVLSQILIDGYTDKLSWVGRMNVILF